MKRLFFGGFRFGMISFSLMFALAALVFVVSPVGAVDKQAAPGSNRLVSISVDKTGSAPTVSLVTDKPVEYRYSVYEDVDPVRVIIDLPGMDVSAVSQTVEVDNGPVKEIKTSATELTSGRLGRVEILLKEPSAFDVSLAAEKFTIAFKPSPDVKVQAKVPAPSKKVSRVPKEAVAQVEPVSGGVVKAVDIQNGRAALTLSSNEIPYKYFTLGAPARLVLDILGTKPNFTGQSFEATGGFDKVRVGIYKDKTRFVFDATGGVLPAFEVGKSDNVIFVDWNGGATNNTAVPETAVPIKTTVPEIVAGVPVTIEAVDFDAADGKSTLVVKLSGETEVGKPQQQGNLVRFDVKKANIPRNLRRVIDASAFPSAVKDITPYTVQEKDGQLVRFAVELKGPVPYKLIPEGKEIRLVVEDGAFAEAAAPALETVNLPVSTSTVESSQVEETPVPREGQVAVSSEVAPQDASVVPEDTRISPESKTVYTGQKVTLVFDDADIRKILQLIAEVSNLNIIVGEEVKGNISLRLIDVPWDQALALVMEIKELGMIQEGNVVRILPKDKIRSMDEAKLTAARTKEKLEELVTEVVSVSYTALSNVAGPARELLTERGKITEDARNKQIIVSDIASRIEEIKKLVKILDTPEKQVMIEARIVEANSNFGRDLGINWAVSYSSSGGSYLDPSTGNLAGGGSFLLPATLGTSGLGGNIRFGTTGIDSTILDLRLAASESRGQSKVISKPRVTTLNGEQATISQGTQIPYQSVGDTGTKTEFVDATLSLDVKPIINPDNTVILEIKASNNTPTTVAGATAPGIDKKEAQTKLLLKDGETTVLGGIFVENEAVSSQGVPILMHIPIIGHLFKSTSKSNDRRELLVFITPRILSE